MTAYRFRVKYEHDPRALWRDILVGGDRTLDEFQTVLNRAVGLDQDHLWFFGTDQDYWDSDVQYKRPEEVEQSIESPLGDEVEYDAEATTVGEMAQHLDLVVGDRICYLFDYGDEWRFYRQNRPGASGSRKSKICWIRELQEFPRLDPEGEGRRKIKQATVRTVNTVRNPQRQIVRV